MQIKVVPRLSKRPYLFKDAFIFLGGKIYESQMFRWQRIRSWTK